MVYPGIALHIPDAVHDDYGSSQLEQTEALKAIFEKHTHAEQFVSEWRTVRTGMAMAADRIAENAGCADIVVIAGVGTDIHQSADMKLLETVIHDSGRPVLVVPPTARPDTLGRSVLIGWNGTREAVRAAHDVLSLLQDGDTAHIVHVNDSSHGADQDATSRELAAAFARHGVETTLVQKTWTHPGVATALNKEAFERGADMIAVGAFGHYRRLAARQQQSSSPLESLFGRRGSLFDDFVGDGLFQTERGAGTERPDGEADTMQAGQRHGGALTERLSSQAEKLLQDAARTATEFGRREVDTEHLLLALTGSEVAAARKHFDEAAEIGARLTEKEAVLKKATEEWKRAQASGSSEVRAADVAQVVSKLTGIPVPPLRPHERGRADFRDQRENRTGRSDLPSRSRVAAPITKS